MELSKLKQILVDNAYIRTGGSAEERKCAEYIQKACAELGMEAVIEPFSVDLATIHKAQLICDGETIPCVGYACSGSGEVEGPVYYLTATDPWSLSQCKGKIVLSDKLMGYWTFKDIRDAGALAFITYNGNANFNDPDLEPRELRTYVSEGNPIPGVHVHVKTAIDLVNKGVKTAKILLEQDQYQGPSHNVIADLPGESEDLIVFTAHYDSTPTSVGVWDNMSGAAALLALAEYFKDHPHRCSLRFIWTGSEERGLLGAKAYCAAHEAELEKTVLNINLDMVGCIMGKRIACCTSEEKLVHYIQYLACEEGVPMEVWQGVYSSDSTPLADRGIPAVSFARIAPPNTASIHNRFDTIDLMKMEHLQEDIDFIAAFADRMANAKRCPVKKEMPDNMKTKLDEYLNRKRPK